VWKDASGADCWVFYDANRRVGASCTAEAQKNCPVACKEVPKCYMSSATAPKPQHLLARYSGKTLRLCLRSDLSASHVMDTCKNLTLQQRQKELANGVAWASSEKHVRLGGVICRRMEQYLKGADSCLLLLDEWERRWRTGEDMTLLWYGGSTASYCSLLQQTTIKHYSYTVYAQIYTNSSSRSYLEVAGGIKAGWTAMSISKTAGKVVYFREG